MLSVSNTPSTASQAPDLRRPAIQTRGLRRAFGEVMAVDDLDLEVPRRGIYGFLGPNGAGKTTTIRLLLGLVRPDGGEIQILGHAMPGARRDALARVGALVEMPSLYDHLSGRENLEVTRRLLGVAPARLDRVLKVVGLRDAAERRAGDYSLGMRQRLGLALALLPDPEILILDEPTNGLDPAGIREMRELIVSLPREAGVTVFLSSHLLSEIEQLVDHLGIVQGGKLRFQGTLADLRRRRQGSVAVGVRRAPDARAMLENAGWTLLPASHGRLHVAPRVVGSTFGAEEGTADTAHTEPEALVATLNALLVGHGFDVHHLSYERPSLESLFLGMTDSA